MVLAASRSEHPGAIASRTSAARVSTRAAPSWMARWVSRLAGVVLAAIAFCTSPVERAEREAAADGTQAALVRPVNSGETGCEAAAGSCAGARVKSDTTLAVGAILADPSVRGYVGLAAYAWDFNEPDSMAGFGPLSAEEASQLLALMTGNWPAAPSVDLSDQHASLQSVRITDDFDTARQTP
jgi:hypothetical protein